MTPNRSLLQAFVVSDALLTGEVRKMEAQVKKEDVITSTSNGYMDMIHPPPDESVDQCYRVRMAVRRPWKKRATMGWMKRFWRIRRRRRSAAQVNLVIEFKMS
jgi:hypothetical protein